MHPSSLRVWLVLIALLGASAYAQDPLAGAVGPPRLYVTIFKVGLAQDSKVLSFDLGTIIEPLSGTRAAAPVTLPAKFIEAARRHVETESLSSKGARRGATSFAAFLHTAPAPSLHLDPTMSLSLLDGAFGSVIASSLNGQPWQGVGFDARIGESGLFLTYFALTQPAQTPQSREAAIEAELQRCVANVGAEVVERKTIPSDPDQSIVEVTARSPRNPSLSILCRFVCDHGQLLALTTVTTGREAPSTTAATRHMFDAFLFR